MSAGASRDEENDFLGERTDLSVEQRAVRGAPWVAAAAWINRILLASVIVVLARKLAPEQLGVLAVALLLTNLLMILNDLGFGYALIYQRYDVRPAAETAFLLSLVVGTVLAAGLFLLAPWISRFFHTPDAENIIRVYAGMIVIDAATSAPISLLSRNLAFSRRFVVEAIPSIVGGILTITLALTGGGVWSLPAGDGVRYVLAFVLAIAVLPVRFWPHWHGDMAAKMWRYARASMLAVALDFALLNVDYAIVARLLGPAQLGYYSLAFRFAILPFYMVTMVVIGVAWPSFARLMPDMGKVRQAFRSSVRLTCATVFFVGGCLVALAPYLEVLGARWAPAVDVARFLGVYVCLRTLAYLIGAVFQAVGRPGVNAALRAVWLALLVGLIATIGRRGIVTVGAIQVLVAAVLTLAYLAVGRSLAGIDPMGFLGDTIRPALAAVIAGLVVTSVRASVGGWLADPTSVWGALVLTALFAATYGTILLARAPSLVRDLRSLKRVARGTPAAAADAGV